MQIEGADSQKSCPSAIPAKAGWRGPLPVVLQVLQIFNILQTKQSHSNN